MEPMQAANDESEAGSNRGSEDLDGDGLTNDEEAFFGTIPVNSPDTDGDTVPDGEDGWALIAEFAPPRLPNRNTRSLSCRTRPTMSNPSTIRWRHF